MNPIRSALWSDYTAAIDAYDKLDKAHAGYFDGCSVSKESMMRAIPPALQAARHLHSVGTALRAKAQAIKVQLSQIKGY